MFTTGGFTVEMHDRPDLWLTGFGQTIAAEVKHFRYKNQDSLDDFVLRNHGDYLVEFGDPSVTEGLVAWDQVASVARRKAVQFKGHTPYLLVVENSSLHCIDDVVVRTAANILDEEASNVAGSPVSRLNGIVLLSNESRMPEGRNVYFFELNASQHSLPHSARAALRGIRRWGY